MRVDGECVAVSSEVRTPVFGHPGSGGSDDTSTGGTSASLADRAVIEIASATLVSDGSGDGMLSPGEMGEVEVYVRNTGHTDAVGVWGEITDVSSTVSVTHCEPGSGADCGGCNCSSESGVDVDAGSDGENYVFAFSFVLDDAAPLSPVDFSLTFHDAAGHIWHDGFQLDVVDPGARVEIATTSLASDSNDDGVLSPGETAEVVVYVRNTGTRDVYGIWSELLDADVHVTVTSCASWTGTLCDSTCNCKDGGLVYAEVGAYGNYHLVAITFTLDAAAPVAPVEFSLRLHDELGHTWDDSFRARVSP